MRGSAILLLSTGLVAATNLLYNILIARMLGASGFGHASALYTLLMLIAAITLSFQIITSKFIARNSETLSKRKSTQACCAGLGRWAWGLPYYSPPAAPTSSRISTCRRSMTLLLLAIAAGVYIPLGVCRGRMQGCCNFRDLAVNVVVEVAVKFGGALFFLHFGMGVTGVMTAVLLSIVAAYIAGEPGAADAGGTGTDQDRAFWRGHAGRAVLHRAGDSQ